MDAETFAEVVDNQLRICKDVLVDKAREYSPDEDRLHNFRVAAVLQNVDMLESLAGMMAKHTVSIYDMCSSEKSFTIDQWNEKITDHINYLILLRAIVQELDDSPEVNVKLTPEEQLTIVLSNIFNQTKLRKAQSNA